MQDWFRKWASVRLEVNVAPGRHTTEAIWRSLVRQSSHFVEWSWDFQKAFDHVDRRALWRAAKAQGDPLDLLAVSSVSYGRGRNFTLNTEVSRRTLHTVASRLARRMRRTSSQCTLWG
jgi:hypothetical protein